MRSTSVSRPSVARPHQQEVRQILRRPELQTKLTVGPANDKYEQEADRVAEQVVGMPSQTAPPQIGVTPIGPQPAIQRACSECEDELQRQTNDSQSNRADNQRPDVSQLVSGALHSGGQALPPSSRDFFESRFGHDFGNVRVHTGRQAADSAQALQARAYTVGSQIVFGKGQYDPATNRGSKLMAHELTHVVQQNRDNRPVLRRQACAHDGQQPRCGGGGQASWRLVDMVTQEVTNNPLDRIIVNQGLARNLGGTWVAQVQTPPNPVKLGTARGYADGLKVSNNGTTLHVGVVEIKSRSTQHHGGCIVASREAAGYVSVLSAISSQIAEVSRSGVAPLPPGRLSAPQRARLAAAGIDMSDQNYVMAWRFYNSLVNRLGATFPAGFANVTFAVNTDGTLGQDYDAGPPVQVPCRTRGRSGVRVRQLLFQVNGAGGISYGCRNTRCHANEDEEQRRQMEQPIAVPDEESDEIPVEDTPTDLTVPVLVGAGGAAALGVAAARRRAARVAAQRLAAAAAQREAQRRAAQAAWRRASEAAARRRAQAAAARGAGRRVAGAAAAKAVVYAEVAAAAFLLLSGRAEASAGPGPSALEGLYDSMTQNGTPPSPEMRALIENDPILRQLAEQAGGGSGTALQEEATRRMLELMRANPDQFSPEDLEVLMQVSNSTSSGNAQAPQTEAELRAAIERARAIQRGEAVPGDGSTGGEGTGAAGSDASGESSREEGQSSPGSGDAREAQERHPRLSAESRQQLSDAPAPVRRLFEAMTNGSGRGPEVNDESLRRFMQTVPGNLTAEEATQLIRQISPSENESLDQILGRLRAAIERVRATDEASDEAVGESRDVPEPASGDREQEGASLSEYARAVVDAINSYGGWDRISVGDLMIRVSSEDTALTTARLNRDLVSVVIYGNHRTHGRIAAYAQVVVVRRDRTSVDIVLRSSAVFVSHSGTTIGTVARGFRLNNNTLIR